MENYAENSIGMAKFLADTISPNFKYIQDAKEIRYFDVGKWMTDISGIYSLRYVTDFAEEVNKLAADAEKDSFFEKFAKSLLKEGNRKSLLRVSHQFNFCSNADFDKSDNLFNCLNCTLDLYSREGKAHDSNDKLTKISNVHYDPDATCPDWVEFIHQIMDSDKDLINYLQKALGYALTTDTKYECMFFLYGPTSRNGKSTLMDTILRVLKDYGKNMQPATLAHRNNLNGSKASSDIARHSTDRLINVSEPPDEFKLNAAMVKQVTGNDPLTTRHLYKNFFEYTPKFKIFVNTNHLPIISDDTLFASGRIKVIPFVKHFDKNNQDKNLKTKFRSKEELSGIFNWLLDGLERYLHEGLEEPDAVISATEEYRKSTDSAGLFIESCYEKGDESERILRAAVYMDYVKWCSVNEYPEVPKNRFLTALQRKFKIKRLSDGFNVIGIRSKN